MKKTLLLVWIALFLGGCKLGGEAVNITEPVTIQETVTGESLTLTMDGVFSFQYEFEPGDAYKVDITDQPDGVICRVENASGEFGEEDITNLVVSCEEDQVFCPLHYAPVCAKKASNIVCITEPCESHQYSTFSNNCFASAERAMMAFDGACDGLQDAVAFDESPVWMVDGALNGDTGKAYVIQKSHISGNRLTLTLQYGGGCAEHAFRLEAEQKLSDEEGKVAAKLQLVHHSDDACEALITSDVTFDLLPVKEFYRRQFGEASGEVTLSELGTYRF